MPELGQNYPNPFNPSTTIAYSVADKSDVKLQIFDVRGRLVRTLVDGERGPNNYRVMWDGLNNAGNSVASGVYFYRLIAGDFRATKKMVLLR
jgi:flagellar hook assembly protein FlgD